MPNRDGTFLMSTKNGRYKEKIPIRVQEVERTIRFSLARVSPYQRIKILRRMLNDMPIREWEVVVYGED